MIRAAWESLLCRLGWHDWRWIHYDDVNTLREECWRCEKSRYQK